MNINNINLIKPLLNFHNDGDFLTCLILLRKKDQLEGEKDNHQSVRIIKSYCINNIEYLDKKMPEIINLCEFFNARAYININEKNHNDISLLMMEKLASRIRNNNIDQTNLFDSIVGELKSKRKRWIVDIDCKDKNYNRRVITIINKIEPIEELNKIIKIIPTLNGFHLITSPFNVTEFNKYLSLSKDILPEIQKNNPTCLYVPSTMFKNE